MKIIPYPKWDREGDELSWWKESHPQIEVTRFHPGEIAKVRRENCLVLICHRSFFYHASLFFVKNECLALWLGTHKRQLRATMRLAHATIVCTSREVLVEGREIRGNRWMQIKRNFFRRRPSWHELISSSNAERIYAFLFFLGCSLKTQPGTSNTRVESALFTLSKTFMLTTNAPQKRYFIGVDSHLVV